MRAATLGEPEGAIGRTEREREEGKNGSEGGEGERKKGNWSGKRECLSSLLFQTIPDVSATVVVGASSRFF